ncbi:MAG: alpha-galactosidase [Lachnospiraceae bacterium]|nr:alpha-galactosidase [Ruminococcus sp.]MCM1275264.1 alpha-galactosidase [Lachnospiraceae bacterium]
MAKLHWRVEVGGQTFNGAESISNGAVRVRCGAPKGVIGKIRAVVPHKMSAGERLFMNGYQTWTYCPEYGKNDKIRGLDHLPKFLVDKFSFDRYGDYHFVNYPNKSGRFHGFSYCYFRRGERFMLAASLDERLGYTIFRYDSVRGLLSIERDCAGVEHKGGELPAFDLYFAEGTEQEVFDGWFSAMNVKPRTDKPLAGYSSWYNRYENITQSTIASDLEGCKTVMKRGDLFQIDDGWEPRVGDWLSPDPVKFPRDMRDIVSEIHSSGFSAGLWLAPFVCETNSALYRERPDWLLKVNGKPWKCGGNWSGFYALDIDVPEVRGYLERVFDRVLNDWGFDLVKLDFLYGAAPFGTRDESRAGRMIRAMELLRKWCGDKLILGCGVPVMPAFGLADYCRVSCDVGLDWDDKPFMRLFHRERVSTRQAIGNTVFRRQLNGRAYLSDPDVFFLREDNIKLTPEQRDKLARVNALLGGVLLTSDDPSKYSPEALEKYSELLRLRSAENVRVNADNGLTVTYVLDGGEHMIRL